MQQLSVSLTCDEDPFSMRIKRVDKLFFPHVFFPIFFPFFSHVFFFFSGLRKHPRRRMPVAKIRTPLAGLWRCCGCVETDLGVGGGGVQHQPKKGYLSLSLCIDNINMYTVYKIEAHVFFSVWAIVFWSPLRCTRDETLQSHWRCIRGILHETGSPCRPVG